MFRTILCSIIISFSIFAQEKTSLTIEQAIEVGLKNSKTLQNSSMKVLAADAKVSEANAALLPSIKLNATYTRLSEVPPFAINIMGNIVNISPSILNNYLVKGTIQQPLFAGFKISSGKEMAEYSAEATKQEYHKDEKELIYNIKNAYWTLYKIRELKKVVDENVEQMKTHVKDAQNLFTQGIITNNEVLKVQIQFSEAELRQVDMNNNLVIATAALNNVIGIPLETSTELTSTIQYTPKTFSSLSELINNAITKREDFAAMQARVKASEANVTFAQSGWYPQIFLVGNYNYANPNQRIVPAEGKFKGTWDVSVVLSYDLWNWGTTSHQTTQAEAQRSQAENTLMQMKDGITLEVTQNYFTFQQTEQKIKISEQSLQQSQEHYRITNERYKNGLSSTSDLLDASVMLLQTKINYTQTLIDYELAKSRLEKSTGE